MQNNQFRRGKRNIERAADKITEGCYLLAEKGEGTN